MHYIGVDIIEVARIKKAIARWGKSFLQRVYTDAELELYHKKPLSLAARFAGKEAVVKVLGEKAQGIAWKEIEILSDPSGKPVVYLYNKARRQSDKLGLDSFAISLSHSKENAIACVIAEVKYR